MSTLWGSVYGMEFTLLHHSSKMADVQTTTGSALQSQGLILDREDVSLQNSKTQVSQLSVATHVVGPESWPGVWQ